MNYTTAFALTAALLLLSGCKTIGKEMRACKKIADVGIASECETRTSKYGGATSVGFKVTKSRTGKLWAFQDSHSYNEAVGYRVDGPHERFLNGQALIYVVIYGNVSDDEKATVEGVISNF